MSGRWPSNFLLTHSPDCVRTGVKRVKTHWSQPTHGAVEKGTLYELGYAGKDNRIGEKVGYADPDGYERVDEWRCDKNCVVAKLGEQSGESKSTRSMRGDLVDNRGDNYGRAEGKRIANSNYTRGHNDKGTAARFFFQADWSYERIEEEELWNGGMADNL